MSIEIKVGLDPEFMVKYKGTYIYPKLRFENTALKDLPDYQKRDLRGPLHKLGYDEFGHCVEIRPAAATSGKQLVLNTIDVMEKLPEDFCYYAENTHRMDKKIFIQLVRSMGIKELSESKNIYEGVDILDDCPADLSARKAGKRLLFCGCHMHVSATKKISITENNVTLTKTENVALPIKSIVRIFDNLLFRPFVKCGDIDFNIGRYRSPGFYEKKFHGGFEYRSLGASVLTPKRLKLIADIMIAVVKHVLNEENTHEIIFQHYMKNNEATKEYPKEIYDMVNELMKTKAVTSNLRSLWVQF